MRRPEALPFLALARGDTALLPEPEAEIDARGLCALAAHHQLGPLCHWHGTRVPELERTWSLLPEDARQELRMAYLHHSVRNDALVQDLDDLTSAIEEQMDGGMTDQGATGRGVRPVFHTSGRDAGRDRETPNLRKETKR